jgi:hypothetical protein
MDEDLRPIGRQQGDGVSRPVNAQNPSIARRDDVSRRRIYREAVTHHPIGENRVWDLIERTGPALEGRAEANTGHAVGTFPSKLWSRQRRRRLTPPALPIRPGHPP